MMTTFKRASWLIALLALVPPILYAYLGSFSRMIQDDDYGVMLIGQEKGAWEGMLYWYKTWSGSYTVRFLFSGLAPLDVLATSLMPPLIVLLWLVGTYWLVCQGLAYLGISRSRRPLAISISALTVAAAIQGFYSPQSFYWYAANTAYGLPVALFTIYMALSVWMAQRLRKDMRSLSGLIALGVIGFLVAGFSEMYLVFQLTLFTFCLLAIFAFLERSARSGYVSVFGAAWLGTLVSLFVQLSSPGGAFRAKAIVNQSGPPDRSVERLLFGTLREALELTEHQAVFIGFIMLMGVGMLVMLIAYQPQSPAAASKPKSDTLGLPLPPPPRFWRRGYLQKHGGWLRAAHILSLPCIFVLLFSISQDFHSVRFLFMGVHALLAVLTWQLSSMLASATARRLGLLALCSYGLGWASLTVIIFVLKFGTPWTVTRRALSASAWLLVFSGLIWGFYIGYAVQHHLLSGQAGQAWIRLLKLGSLLVVLVIAVSIVLGQVALVPDFRLYAQEWDEFHQEVIAQRDSGKTIIEVEPFTFDLARYVGVPALLGDKYKAAEIYYKVESIVAKGG